MYNIKFNAVMAAGIFGLLSSTAMSAPAPASLTIQGLPAEGKVTVSGTVHAVKDTKHFTLSDSTGKIDIELSADERLMLDGKPATLKKGDRVTVVGKMDSNEHDINATEVDIHETFSEIIDDAMPERQKRMTAAEAETAKANAMATTKIDNLPDEGIVKVSGIVEDVDKKEFTLKDSTGEVDVMLTTINKPTNLAEGAKVTVVGQVDGGIFKGFFDKDIRANYLMVTSTSKTSRR